MKRLGIVFMVSMSSWLTMGCGGEALLDDEEAIGESADALEIENALNANALNANAIHPNALNANALNANALNANALNANALASLQDPGTAGALSRQLVKYTVSCALDASQTFELDWVDALGRARHETYRGLLGLEPSWAEEPLSEAGQRWVSACLASRVNYYGVSVIISSRGGHPKLDKAVTAPEELTTFDHEEGAFWGNLFSPEPAVHACFNQKGVDYARSKYRECAAGHLLSGKKYEECGVIDIVGSCQKACGGLTAHQHYGRCSDGSGSGARTAEVVTVFLD